MGVPVTCLELLGDLVRCILMCLQLALTHAAQLVAGSGDGRVRTFNVNTLRAQQTIVVNDAHRPIACLLAHGNSIWLGVHQSIAKLQRSEDNVLALGPTLEGHQSSVTCLEVVEDVLWSGSADGELRRWDINSGACLSSSASGMPRLFTILRAGSRVWCGGMSSEIFVYSSEVRLRVRFSLQD